jgi:hypothetical protein
MLSHGENTKPSASPAATTDTEPGQQGSASRTPASEEDEISDDDKFRIECFKGAAYHDGCERSCAFWHRLIMFFVTLSGTAAFGAWAADWVSAKWLSLATAVLGLFDLVLDLSGSAREHAGLRRRYGELLAEFESGDLSLARAKVALHRIWAEEPTQYCAANAIAYNVAMRQLDRPAAHLLRVPVFRRFCCHWWRSAAYDFKRQSEFKSAWMRFNEWYKGKT